MTETINVEEFHAKTEARYEYQKRAIRIARAKRYLTDLEKSAVETFVDTLLDVLPITDDDYEKAVDAAVEYAVRDPVLLKVLSALEAEGDDRKWESRMEAAADQVIAAYRSPR